jgi:hypothetical protein
MAIAGRSDDEWGAPTKQQLAELPRDPQKLYDLMAADLSVVNKPKFGGVLDIASKLLKTGTVPADLKESIYRAVAKIPGLKVTEQVANLDGRTGVALKSSSTPPPANSSGNVGPSSNRTTRISPGRASSPAP